MSSEKRKNKTINEEDFINSPLWGVETEARRGIPHRRKLHRKREEETSSPPQKATTARPPLYSAAG
jgi:hypothetical protein